MKIRMRVATNEVSIPISVSAQPNITMSVDMKGVSEKYTGDYVVTPIVNNNIILETKDKIMVDDVTVKKIPVYEIDNAQGGTTVYIAMEVE